jgi:mRNA interferase HigB
MNIYNKKTINEFFLKHPNCKKQLLLWYHDVSEHNWKSSNDVKRDFASASIINRYRVVFNIKGNDYRLIAEINYQNGWLFIKFIGTHAEYDKVNAATINLY